MNRRWTPLAVFAALSLTVAACGQEAGAPNVQEEPFETPMNDVVPGEGPGGAGTPGPDEEGAPPAGTVQGDGEGADQAPPPPGGGLPEGGGTTDAETSPEAQGGVQGGEHIPLDPTHVGLAGVGTAL
jgi:hypothetical protein